MSTPTTCPRCGSRQTSVTETETTYSCGYWASKHMESIPPECHSRAFAGQRDQIHDMKARIKRLEKYADRLEKAGDKMTPDTTGDMKEAWDVLGKEHK